MRAALEEFRDELGFSLREVDIDADPDLVARFGTLIPVLVMGGREICHYHLDPTALRRALESAGETG
ncbi:MAG: glutaredoxin family protein [Betaproteobacteria bacterium]|nr:glutaredoxin family protein [Betaproteobacteria bacterium]